MRILFVLPSIERFTAATGGAVATVTLHLAEELCELGHDVAVAAVPDENPPYENVPYVPIRFTETVNPIWKRLVGLHRRAQRYDFYMYGAYLSAVRKALAQLPWSPDLIVYHNDLRLGQHLRRWRPSSRRVLWLHNDIESQARRPLTHFAAADHLIAVSDHTRRALEQRYGVRAERFTVAINGVDAEQFSPEAAPSRSTSLRVLFLGRLLYDKGADILLQAVIALQEEGHDVTVDVVGSPWWWGDSHHADPYLNGTVLPLVDAAQGTWQAHTPRDRVPAIYRVHDVVGVLGRYPDPCPLVVLEAFAAGCAVVASDLGGIPEQSAGAAVLVPAGDVDAATDALRRLAESPAWLAECKARARARGLELTWRRTAETFLTAVGAQAESTAPTEGPGRAAPRPSTA